MVASNDSLFHVPVTEEVIKGLKKKKRRKRKKFEWDEQRL